MLKKKEKDLVEKIVTGGGATGQSMTADASGGKATLPKSNSNSEAMPKGQNPDGTPIEETDTENNVKATGDNSAKNKASISMKPSAASASMKEDVAKLFADMPELTEEFIEKATTIFEAHVALKVDEIEEQYAATLDEEVEAIKTELAEKVDTYLNSISEEWLTENEVAIEKTLRTEIAEEFMDGLASLFKEHYINIPEEKLDVVEDLATTVEELQSALNASMNESIELKGKIVEFEKNAKFEEIAEGLALTEVEKLRTIAEGLEFTNIDNFVKKLTVVKEQYFTTKNEAKTVADSNILTEGVELEETSTSHAPVDPDVARIAAAISRAAKIQS